MICKNCGSQLSEGTKFCESCGTPAESNFTAEEQFSQPMQGAVVDTAVPKKKSKKKFIIIGVIVAVVLILIIAIAGSSSEPDDSAYIDVVKTGVPYAYPDQTWGDALEDLCGSSGDWKSFIGSSDGGRYVEFNGTTTRTDEKICIQWRCEDPDADTVEFELRYIEFDGENYTTDENISAFIVYIFEGQPEE
jgi:hypothetical protein